MPNSTARTVAVIDIGSNSVRMAVAQVTADGGIEVLERTQRSVRLGHSTFLAGRLSRQTMNAAITILRDYRRILDTYKVQHVRAVATSAVREADNADAFLDRASIAAGLDVEVIEPAEETRLTISAVRDALGESVGINRDRALIVEIGGGSGLLTILENGEITATEACNLGSIRLQETLGTFRESPRQAAALIRRHISNVVAAIGRTTSLADVECFVAIGGDARFAAQRIGEPTGVPETYAVDIARFDEFVESCCEHTTDGIVRRHGISFANAETLVPALLAYRALLKACRAETMIVSNVSLRDGLLHDLAHYVTGVEDPVQAQGVLQSARTMGEKYRYDARHAEQVRKLTLRLFDELRAEHRLEPRYRLLLEVAAILHEIGGFVSGRAHHKHSYYLIANAEIFGLRRPEREIVAHVARYHRRSAPKRTHLDYVSLPREHRVVVGKLAAILRIADALDRGHAQQVRDIEIERRPEELVIYVRGAADLTLERRGIAEKGDLFEDAYGMTIRLEEAAAGRRLADDAASGTP